MFEGKYRFPLQKNGKAPLAGSKGFKEATLDFEPNSEYNIGIATGKESNLTVIDIDGDKGLASLEIIKDRLPDTMVVKTPKGEHHYLKYNPDLKTTTGIMPGIDIRNDGGYVVAPPSVVNGIEYKVINDRPIMPCDNPPEELLKRIKPIKHLRMSDVTGDDKWIDEAMKGVAEGERNWTATRLAGYLHHKRMAPDIIARFLQSFADKCTPALPMEEVMAVIDSVCKYPVNDADRLVPVLVRMADVQAKPVEWIWRGRVPKGKIMIIDGDPSVGKSFLSLGIASAFTLGLGLPDPSYEGGDDEG